MKESIVVDVNSVNKLRIPKKMKSKMMLYDDELIIDTKKYPKIVIGNKNKTVLAEIDMPPSSLSFDAAVVSFINKEYLNFTLSAIFNLLNYLGFKNSIVIHLDSVSKDLLKSKRGFNIYYLLYLGFKPFGINQSEIKNLEDAIDEIKLMKSPHDEKRKTVRLLADEGKLDEIGNGFDQVGNIIDALYENVVIDFIGWGNIGKLKNINQ